MNKRVAMGIIGSAVCIIALLVGYGFYLNFSSEKNISQQIKFGTNRHLQGVAVRLANVSVDQEFQNIRFEANVLEDAIAKGNGMVLDVFVAEHQYVKKGQSLMQIDSDSLKLQIAEVDENLSRTKTNAERYRVTLERYERLLADDAISAERCDDAKANYLGAMAEVRAMERRKAQLELNLEQQLIRAPVDGEVLRIYKNVGSYVTQGTPVAMVGDFSRLYFRSYDTDANVRAYLQGEYDDWYMTISEDSLQSTTSSHIYGGQYAVANRGDKEGFKLRLESVAPPLDRPADYRNFVYSIDNSSGILEPRNYAKVRIRARGSHRGLVIPVLARYLDKGSTWVYVWNKKHEIERRTITTGQIDGEMIEVLCGLRESEVVVIPGPDALKEGTVVEVELVDNAKAEGGDD